MSNMYENSWGYEWLKNINRLNVKRTTAKSQNTYKKRATITPE